MPLRAVYRVEAVAQPIGNKIAAVDLGELRSATTHDGEQTVIYNGRLIKSKVAYHNKVTASMQEFIAKTKKGSVRRKRLVRTKKRQAAKLNQQINDILHKQTRHIVSTQHKKRGANAGYRRYSGYPKIDKLRERNEPKTA